MTTNETMKLFRRRRQTRRWAVHRRHDKVTIIHLNATCHIIFRAAFIARGHNRARKVRNSARAKTTHTGPDVFGALDPRGQTGVNGAGWGEDRGGRFLHQRRGHCAATGGAVRAAANSTQCTEIARAGAIVGGAVLQ